MAIAPTKFPIRDTIKEWRDEYDQWDFRSAGILDGFEVSIIDAHQCKLATQLWMKSTSQRWTAHGYRERHVVRFTRVA